jgi:hypothetical protein
MKTISFLAFILILHFGKQKYVSPFVIAPFIGRKSYTK